MEEIMCDLQLVSLLADDVTKKKDELRKELLESKRGSRNIPLSSITLTAQEKRDCMTRALDTITWNLPEETRREYRREIAKLLNARKEQRKQTRKGILACKKKPSNDQNSQPEKQQITIKDTSKATQLELFTFNALFPWFRPYMDQP